MNRSQVTSTPCPTFCPLNRKRIFSTALFLCLDRLGRSVTTCGNAALPFFPICGRQSQFGRSGWVFCGISSHISSRSDCTSFDKGVWLYMWMRDVFETRFLCEMLFVTQLSNNGATRQPKKYCQNSHSYLF